MKQTLKEYESTLDNQSTKIQSLESEGEILHGHNEELQLKCAELTAKTQSLENARSSLKSRADQLSQELQGQCCYATLTQGGSFCRTFVFDIYSGTSLIRTSLGKKGVLISEVSSCQGL